VSTFSHMSTGSGAVCAVPGIAVDFVGVRAHCPT
jgi:hypothetical protein